MIKVTFVSLIFIISIIRCNDIKQNSTMKSNDNINKNHSNEPEIMLSINKDTVYITNYLYGKKNGLSKHFYENGRVQLFLNYKNDKLDGICDSYFMNGKLRSRIKYRSDLIWEIMNVNDSLGNSLDFGKIKDGNGFLKHYLFDGNYEEGKIKNGLKDGHWKTVSNSGHVGSVFYFFGESEYMPGYIDNFY